MKIYNEVVSIFNDLTNQWETISEDSYEYSGDVSLAQGVLPANSSPIASADTITDTIKISSNYGGRKNPFGTGWRFHTGLDIHAWISVHKMDIFYKNPWRLMILIRIIDVKSDCMVWILFECPQMIKIREL